MLYILLQHRRANLMNYVTNLCHSIVMAWPFDTIKANFLRIVTGGRKTRGYYSGPAFGAYPHLGLQDIMESTDNHCLYVK
jgi:hypothetical protein